MDCVHPRNVRVPGSQQYITVPCGMCIGCRIAKTREWTIRLMMEKDSWKEKSVFMTFTYDDDHLPMTNCGRPTLHPDHMTKMWKRLRMVLHRDKMKNDPEYARLYGLYLEDPVNVSSPPLLRYFMCGEYGDETKRPHYHAAVYGISLDDEKLMRKIWPYGFIQIAELTKERAQYVAGYVQKKIYKDPWKYFQEYGCCVHPYQRVSQGIGKGFMDNPEFWYLDPKIKGVHYSVPRYFLKKNVMAEYIIHERVERLKEKGAFANTESYESMLQREYDMKARSRMKKGKL